MELKHREMVFSKQKIFDYLDGKLSTFEIRQIEAWYSNPANEELFYSWLDEWERSHLTYVPGEGKLSEKRRLIFSGRELHAEVPEGDRDTNGAGRTFFSGKYILRAAVVMIIAAITGFFLPYESILTKEFVTREGETRSLSLADGSQVTLNAGTTLKVPRFGFGRHTREVILQGEALFSVVSTEDRKRFVVKTANAADVIVLGTEFSVFSKSDVTRVKLNHGKVLLRYQDADKQLNELDMLPGEQITLNTSGKITVKQAKEEASVPEWAIREFRFEKTSLKEIVKLLDNSYGMEVRLQDEKMGALSLTGTYEVYRGSELMEIVAEVLGIGIHYDKDKYILVSKPD